MKTEKGEEKSSAWRKKKKGELQSLPSIQLYITITSQLIFYTYGIIDNG